MNIQRLLICLYVSFLTSFSSFAQGKVWSVEKARKWAEKKTWYCGVNYIPANAINYTAMWDKTSFSPDVIDREMQLMKELGMNCARVVMQYAVYEDDPAYFLRTLDTFLGICDKYGVQVMPIFFDDCAFGVNTDPVVGQQPEPLKGWYAWAWSPSPGYSMVVDERTHGKLEKYVKEVMTRFKDDDRILYGICIMSLLIRQCLKEVGHCCARFLHGHGRLIRSNLSRRVCGTATRNWTISCLPTRIS